MLSKCLISIRRLKALVFDIRDADYNFNELNSELERYCIHNSIPARTKYRIMLAIEEVVQQMLLPRGRQLPVRVIVEYSAEEEKATVTISYGGTGFDPSEAENRLSYNMLKQSVSDIQYLYDDEAELHNIITVNI